MDTPIADWLRRQRSDTPIADWVRRRRSLSGYGQTGVRRPVREPGGGAADRHSVLGYDVEVVAAEAGSRVGDLILGRMRPRFDWPLAGRARELSALREILDRA